ncbi:hypothetical protein [Nodosilinea sp. LEGE 07088]|nr:hypothetical protein [Nodosilinea sp. LEGE 07088]
MLLPLRFSSTFMELTKVYNQQNRGDITIAPAWVAVIALGEISLI